MTEMIFFFKLRYFISFIIYISLFSCVTSDELLKYSGSDSIMYSGLAASSCLSASDSEFKSVFRPYISQQFTNDHHDHVCGRDSANSCISTTSLT